MLGEWLTDSTAVAIGVAAVATIIHFIVSIFRGISFELVPLLLTFMAVMAIAIGIETLAASIMGDPGNLPSHWREYIAISSLACIIISTQHFINLYRDISKHSSRKTNKGTYDD